MGKGLVQSVWKALGETVPLRRGTMSTDYYVVFSRCLRSVRSSCYWHKGSPHGCLNDGLFV